MHEMALTESIVEIVQEECRRLGAKAVRRVRVEVGAVSHVEPQALAFCFEAVARGTVAEGAAFEIVARPAEGWCFDCERTTPLTERFGACAHCGGRRVQMTAGDELRVQELEVE